MRALVQRVSEARVEVSGRLTGKIGPGILVFLGIHIDDDAGDADYLANRIIQLRIFPDVDGKMNLSLKQIAGEMLIVSQFTLYGDTSKGNRPSYSQAARPEVAAGLYDYFVQICRSKEIPVATGVFGADMQVGLINDGPITLLCYSEKQPGLM